MARSREHAEADGHEVVESLCTFAQPSGRTVRAVYEGFRDRILADLRAAINARGLSNLCAPRALIVVPGIPKLGTGKTNHRELEKLIAA